MAKEWYWLDGGASKGPEEIDELAGQCHREEISSSTLVWRMGEDKWIPLGEALSGLGKFPPPLPGSNDEMSPSTAPPQVVNPDGHVPSPSPVSSPVGVQATSQPPQQTTDKPQWTDAGPHPWPRYFARMIDSTINGLLVFFVVGIIWSFVSPDAFQQFVSMIEGNQVADIFVTLLAAIPVNALLIGLTGSSVGKWFLGVRVLGPDQRPIGFTAALSREFAVWAQGLGLGIPLVNLVAMIRAFGTLKKSGKASWDLTRNIEVLHRPSGTMHHLLSVAGVVLLVVFAAVLRSL